MDKVKCTAHIELIDSTNEYGVIEHSQEYRHTPMFTSGIIKIGYELDPDGNKLDIRDALIKCIQEYYSQYEESKMKELTASEIGEWVMKTKPPHWELWRQNNTAIPGRAFIGRKGVGDYTGYDTITGKRIEIEVKKRGDMISDNQAALLVSVAKSGGNAYVAIQNHCDICELIKVVPNDTKHSLNNYLRKL